MKKHTEESEPQFIEAESFAKILDLSTMYAEPGQKIKLCTVNVNRPGLLLTGHEDYFADNRVQVFGKAEIEYLKTLNPEQKKKILIRLLSREIPCLVISRDMEVPQELLAIAKEYKRPVFVSKDITSNIMNAINNYLNDLLAPVGTIHGVLLDLHGVGVLLSGESGIGKSETALELVKRGHRLVADDAVIIKNIKNRIMGTSPEVIRYFMEIRGIGIIDVRSIFGVGSILQEKEIELVLELENWDDEKQYERLGLNQEYVTLLNVKVPKIIIPVKPGRNLAIIAEVAARNQRLKESGYNAAEEINKRITAEEN